MRSLFPASLAEAMGSSVALEAALGPEAPAVDCLLRVAGEEYLVEEATIEQVSADHLARSHSNIYRTIDAKSDQFRDFREWLESNEKGLERLRAKGFALTQPLHLLVLKIETATVSLAAIEAEVRRTLRRKVIAAQLAGKTPMIRNVLILFPDSTTCYVHREEHEHGEG